MFTSLLSVLVFFTVTGQPEGDGAPSKETEFFAGVFLLQADSALSAGAKAERFIELQRSTGITAAEARALLMRYREKPKAWQERYQAVLSLLAARESDSSPKPRDRISP